MATNVLCSAIGPSAPSYLASRFGSHIPSRMATNVLCSAIGPSAPSYMASRFFSHIPSRMATTVLCSTIGPSAPSCLFHVRITHPLQDGDKRLICSTISTPTPSCLARVRLAHPFQDGDEHLLYSSIGPSAASCLVHLRLRPCHLGWGTRLMQHDWPLGGIMSSPPSAPPMPSRMGDLSYAARLLLGADMPELSMRATASRAEQNPNRPAKPEVFSGYYPNRNGYPTRKTRNRKSD
ncbi:unnamed protein product [Cuscuta epithymum]|uniref:Uncharacterized protein n=1 Tax=Cuscuta epithymum TaxID=186058 RepID=A0AAV0E299_9ASTE|nr:unnamed protein product [Cuscuta epithymum]